MTLNVTHAFVSGVADDPTAAAAGEVLPSHWNANHVLTGAGGGPSIDTAILYDKAGVIGEDTRLQFEYAGAGALRLYNVAGSNYERATFDWTTSANVLTIGTQAAGGGFTRPIKIIAGDGTTTGVVGSLDFNITNADSWTFGNGSLGTSEVFLTYLEVVGASGTFNGNYVHITGDAGQRIFFGCDGNHSDSAVMTFGSGTVAGQDTSLYRESAGVFEIVNPANQLLPTGLHSYNRIDLLGNSGPPMNYEVGVFDWTTTSNVLTIGTQKGGSGTLRAVQLVGASITAQNASLSVAADTGGIASTNTISSANSTTIGAGTGTVKMSSANNANNTGWLKCYIGTQVAWIPCWTTNAP